MIPRRYQNPVYSVPDVFRQRHRIVSLAINCNLVATGNKKERQILGESLKAAVFGWHSASSRNHYMHEKATSLTCPLTSYATRSGSHLPGFNFSDWI